MKKFPIISKKPQKGDFWAKKNGSLFEFCIGGGSIKSHTLAERFGRHQKNEPHINYESRAIIWYKIPIFDEKKQAHLEKTHIWVILCYKIDHFCPLKSNFHSFSAIWPNLWIWNSLLPSIYHLLAQVRHAQSHFFPLGTNDWAKNKPRLKKIAVFFGNQESF